ncbi:hypothetical protein GIB67_034072 [Kingdonia uniflora]|uniref:Uncharacterized protein n=1 Tax=Kingdonia uniflora TaxID=39325 RepID=A0A7J7M680_9MAGN|nr:hypothetical protein GIB67_034072 [Kingdonia uniflora]
MTPTLDDVEQLVGLPVDGDATVIGGTRGFPVIIEVFENNLLQDLNAFNSLKVGGAGNLLSLNKLKEHYAYKLEKETDVSAHYLVLFAKDKVAKKWSWGSVVLAHMYYNLGAASRDDGRQFACCTTLLEPQTSECDLLKETIEQMKVEIELKHVVDEQCALEFTDLLRQLDAKILEYKNLEEKNTSLECKEIESLKTANAILMEQIDMQLPPATPLVVLQSHQPVPDTTLAKKYEDLLAAHEDVKKKLITKDNFEVWRQALKKALASEEMGDMGDPTFEELFEQNERFFTIAQQEPKGDYQEDLVSTAVTLENVVIARREKMAKKKKMQ